MKTNIKTLLITILSLMSGILLGIFLTMEKPPSEQSKIDLIVETNVEAVVSLEMAARLETNIKTIDLLRGGETNRAINMLITQIDSDMIRLAARPNSSLFETNITPALSFSKAYRKTNSWMNVYGFGKSTNTMIYNKLHALLNED